MSAGRRFWLSRLTTSAADQFTIKNSTDPLPREKAVPFILCGFFYNVRCVVVFNGFPVQGLFMANERYD